MQIKCEVIRSYQEDGISVEVNGQNYYFEGSQRAEWQNKYPGEKLFKKPRALKVYRACMMVMMKFDCLKKNIIHIFASTVFCLRYELNIGTLYVLEKLVKNTFLVKSDIQGDTKNFSMKLL